MKRIDAYWYSQNPVAWLLLPVTALYCLLVFVRRFFYRTGIFKSYKVSVPVIIVGNITVGGTGKTPLLVSLCELLKSQGYKPGVVSRGYGGNFEGERLVSETDDVNIIGDEPCLISKRTHCPIVVGRDRVAAAQLLLDKTDCNAILSDDGLQHYRLGRDIEIAIVDNNRQFGNGFCLPSGPLRETVSRLKRVDIVIDHCADTEVVACDDRFSLQFAKAVNLKTDETKNIKDFVGRPVHAVAGIGHPARFFNQLRKNGLEVIEHDYPDHHKFDQNDLIFDDDYPLLMTEKDAVKCQKFSDDHLWYVPVSADLSEHFKQCFLSRLNEVAEKVKSA